MPHVLADVPVVYAKEEGTVLFSVLLTITIGVMAIVIVLGFNAFASTRDLTAQLIEARTNEFASEFQRLGDYNYAIANSLQSMVNQLQLTSASPRECIMEVLRNIVETDPSILVVWTAWEPNALDGGERDKQLDFGIHQQRGQRHHDCRWYGKIAVYHCG